MCYIPAVMVGVKVGCGATSRIDSSVVLLGGSVSGLHMDPIAGLALTYVAVII